MVEVRLIDHAILPADEAGVLPSSQSPYANTSGDGSVMDQRGIGFCSVLLTRKRFQWSGVRGGALPASQSCIQTGRIVGQSELFCSDSAAKAISIWSGTLRYSAVCSLPSQFTLQLEFQ
jgi:hypothetical protein